MKSKQYEIALVHYAENSYHNTLADVKEIEAMSEWFFVSEDEFNSLKFLAKRINGYAVILRIENQIVKQQLEQAKKFKKAMKRYDH